MSGLTGLLRSSPSDDIIGQVVKMTARLVHRGPDDEGVWSEGGIVLGHRWLAILDLSATGAQEYRRYVLAYNGEIYSHLDLRDALETEDAAPQWHGQSDTETLLASIAHWGLDAALRRAHGIFAFAVWGRSKQRLSLARDRFGTPLEQRFTRSEILKRMQDAGLEGITFSEEFPFWCAVGRKRQPPA